MKKKLQKKRHRKLRKCERSIKTKSISAKYYRNHPKKELSMADLAKAWAMKI